MNKSNVALGVLAAAVVVVGVALFRSPEIAVNSSELAASAGVVTDASGIKSVIVTYTNTGFSPAVAKVSRGGSIYFINMSDRALRIAPLKNPADASSAYLGFEASKSVKNGESYGVSLTTPGIWGYKNLNAPATVGVVIVE